MINIKPTGSNIIFLLIIIAMVIIGAPLALIWAINTLFPALVIPYTIETWLAAFIIPAAFKTNVSTK
jgi:hypothetical protein